MEPYKYTGLVHQVGKTQTFQSGFAKRTLILKEPGGGKYTNYAAFEFTRSKDGTKDGTKALDRLLEGMMIEVTFHTQANESKTRPGSWFVSNRAVKVECIGDAEVDLTPSQTRKSAPEPEPSAEDDMPF